MSDVRSDESVALCEIHAERFSVPDGWTMKNDSLQAPEPEEIRPRHRIERTPWFAVGVTDSTNGLATVEETPAPAMNSGSGLLHRAFHGPLDKR